MAHSVNSPVPPVPPVPQPDSGALWWMLPETPRTESVGTPEATPEPAPPEPPATSPVPADTPLAGTCCPTCRTTDLVDDPGGIACTRCDALAFHAVEDGSLVRADALTPDDEVDVDSVPVCPDCGRWCDTETLYGSWRCSGCDPAAESRRRRTKWILRFRDQIVERHAHQGRN